MQTAVEWLIEHLLDNGVGIHKKVRETALELEQIQKMELLNRSKGSDEHIVDTNEMISSQTEISDEEIEMAALHNEPRVTRRAFKSGAKWYREQLKCKGNG